MNRLVTTGLWILSSIILPIQVNAMNSDLDAVPLSYSASWTPTRVERLIKANETIDEMTDEILGTIVPKHEWEQWDLAEQQCLGCGYNAVWELQNGHRDESLQLIVYHWPQGWHRREPIEVFTGSFSLEIDGHDSISTLTKVNENEVLLDYAFDGWPGRQVSRCLAIGNALVQLSYSYFPHESIERKLQPMTEQEWESKRSLWLQRFMNFHFEPNDYEIQDSQEPNHYPSN